MKTIIIRAFLSLMALATLTSQSSAQTKIIETRTTVDSANHKTTVTYDTIYEMREDVTPRSSLVSISPFKFIWAYNVTYYHTLSPKVMGGLGVMLSTFSDPVHYGVNIEGRYYPAGKAPRGFYLAPNAYLTWGKEEVYYLEEYVDPVTQIRSTNSVSGRPTVGSLSIGLLGAWQWFPSDEFAISFGLGVDDWIQVFSKGSSSYGDLSYGWSKAFGGLAPAMRFDIGYSW